MTGSRGLGKEGVLILRREGPKRRQVSHRGKVRGKKGPSTRKRSGGHDRFNGGLDDGNEVMP
jgi:hypothetical protein